MKKVKQYPITLLILFWVGLNQLYWALAPHIATYNNTEGLHTSLNLILHATTGIGPDIVMLLLGLLLSTKAPHQPKSAVIKIWLNTLVLGCITCLILMFCVHNASAVYGYIPTSAVLDSLLPILRGSYPLITGTLIGLLISKIIGELPQDWQKRTIYLIIVLIALSLFAKPNMFGWADHGISLFYALLFVLGQYGFRFLAARFSSRSWLLIGLITFIVNCGLQFIMPSFSTDSSVIQRYATPVNILSVVCAFAIVLLTKKFFSISSGLLISYLVLIENSAVIAWLTGITDTKIGHSSFRTGILAIISVVAAIVLAWVWTKLSKLTIIQRYVQRIDHFSKQSFDKQTALLKRKLPLTTLCQLLLAYLIAFISLLAMNDGWRIKPNTSLNYNVFAYLLGQRQLIILLNALFIFATIKFIQAITRRYWFSLSLTLLLNIILMVDYRMKLAT